MFASSTKREISHFHVVVVQWLQRNVQKSVMHVQSCCFANQNLLLFCRSRWRRLRRCRCRRSLLGTLRSKDATATRTSKKQQQQQLYNFARASHFLCISLPFLHDYDVKIPNFAFHGERKQATTKFYFSFCTWIWSLRIQLQESSPTFDKVGG